MRESQENNKAMIDKIQAFAKKTLKKGKSILSLKNKTNWLSVLGNIVMYGVLIIVSFILLSPLIDMLSTAIMSRNDIIDPEVFYIPRNFTIQNFSMAVNIMKYWQSLLVTVLYSGGLAIIQIIISALTAYAFARYNFKFKKFWFIVLIGSFILPTTVLVIPRKLMFDSFTRFITNFGIPYNRTAFGLIPIFLITLLGQGVYSTILILIFYQFFKQIPFDLDEAAYMDGASSAQVFYHIILKLSIPVIFTVFLFSFVWNWNESTMTAFFLGGDVPLLPTQLSRFQSLFDTGRGGGTERMYEGFKMAGTFLSILPLIILYLFVQRRFIEGIEQTGMTGL